MSNNAVQRISIPLSVISLLADLIALAQLSFLFWFSVKWTQATKNKSLMESLSLLPKKLTLCTRMSQFLAALVKNLGLTLAELVGWREVANG